MLLKHDELFRALLRKTRYKTLRCLAGETAVLLDESKLGP